MRRFFFSFGDSFFTVERFERDNSPHVRKTNLRVKYLENQRRGNEIYTAVSRNKAAVALTRC